MGVATTDVEGRVAASMGELNAVAPNFAPAIDVPNGGLLFALPALLAVGLLDDLQNRLVLPKGYHHAANAATDQVIEKLCEELNATETVFPRTNLRLILKLGSA